MGILTIYSESSLFVISFVQFGLFISFSLSLSFPFTNQLGCRPIVSTDLSIESTDIRKKRKIKQKLKSVGKF